MIPYVARRDTFILYYSHRDYGNKYIFVWTTVKCRLTLLIHIFLQYCTTRGSSLRCSHRRRNRHHNLFDRTITEKTCREHSKRLSSKNSIDIIGTLGNNPPSSLRGPFMASSSSIFSILLLTANAEVQAQFRQDFKEASVTIARDAAAFQKEVEKHQFDAVVIESRNAHGGAMLLPNHVDPSRTLVITGSQTVLKKTVKVLQILNQHNGSIPQQGKIRNASLESYLDMKMGDFVKGMRNGSAKNLHPILISAVERPLITSALQETQGNQIQAAELLGLNRNTLRKKIAALHIPLKRTRAKTRRLA